MVFINTHSLKLNTIRAGKKISPPARKTGGLLSRAEVELYRLTSEVGGRDDSLFICLGILFLTAV
jgi:hypothetical protein